MRPRAGLLLTAAILIGAPLAFADPQFDEPAIRDDDKYPPPLQLREHGPDKYGFHFTWATDAEEEISDKNDCYGLNYSRHLIYNSSEDALIYSWNDARLSAAKHYPLASGGIDRRDTPTTARTFRPIAPSTIRLGQNLNYTSDAAVYVPTRDSESACEQPQSEIPSLTSTMLRDVMRNNEPVRVHVSVESRPIVEGGNVHRIDHILKVDNIDGVTIGLVSLPEFFRRLEPKLQNAALSELSEALKEHDASFKQRFISDIVSEESYFYLPDSLKKAEYGFVELGESGEATFPLQLSADVKDIEEQWFSVVAIDKSGHVITNGLASSWIPTAQ